MNNAINLTLNPHYTKSFRFFILSLVGLFACGSYLLHAHTHITGRWDNETIVAVHLFTLGFLLPIFLGSITQLLPVLFGITNDVLKIFDRLILVLPIASLIFLYAFQQYDLNNNYFLLLIMSVFWLTLTSLILSLIKRAYLKYKELDKVMYLHLMSIGRIRAIIP